MNRNSGQMFSSGSHERTEQPEAEVKGEYRTGFNSHQTAPPFLLSKNSFTFFYPPFFLAVFLPYGVKLI